MNFAKAAELDTGIDLGRRDRRVTKHFLHDPQISTPREEVGGEAVPQGVRADVRVQAGGLRMPLDDPPEGHPR